MGKIINIMLALIIWPLTFLFGIFRGILIALKGGMVPIETIIEKGNVFLTPQINAIKNEYKNKKSVVITWDSLVYAVGIGEEVGGRPIMDEEVFPYLLAVYGQDFEKRITYLLQSLKESYEPGTFNIMKSNMRSLVKDDAEKGVINGSNFLLTNAESIYSSFNKDS